MKIHFKNGTTFNLIDECKGSAKSLSNHMLAQNPSVNEIIKNTERLNNALDETQFTRDDVERIKNRQKNDKTSQTKRNENTSFKSNRTRNNDGSSGCSNFTEV